MPEAPLNLIRPWRWWHTTSAIASAVTDMPPIHTLRLATVSYRYGDSAGIHGASLTIMQGTLTVATGKVGSGKSTLLNLMSGSLAPQTGGFGGTSNQSRNLGAPHVVATTQIPFW
jgi:ATP-binding cassette subfamily B protein